MKKEIEDFLLNGSLYEPWFDVEELRYNFFQILFDAEIIKKISPNIINNLESTDECFNEMSTFQTINSYCSICDRETSFTSTSCNNHYYSEFVNQCLESGYEEFHRVYEFENGHGANLPYSRSLLPFMKSIAYRISNIGPILRVFECAHSSDYNKHILSFIFVVKGGKIIKIGQFPSVNDLTGNDLKKYKRIGNDIFVELNRAKGLHSHGVGIGAYAYLRRIIEKYIVNKKFKEYLLAQNKSPQEIEETQRTTRFNDKVTLIKEELSDLLHENPKIYGVISKGLHELSEKDCKQYFSVLFQSVCMILDDEIEKLEKADKKKRLKSELNNLI